MNSLTEQLQENVSIYLDGFPDYIIAGVQQVIVDTIKTGLDRKEYAKLQGLSNVTQNF